ncbi:MAG TPA: hypothetical protein VK934_07580 [Fimbriimonas sp.]|nr:hypothetical protein [Fimbriimonas sp.]
MRDSSVLRLGVEAKHCIEVSLKWATLALLGLAAFFCASMGACCVTAIVPQDHSPDRGMEQAFAFCGWILLPVWLAGLFFTGRHMIRVWRDED